VVAVTGVLGGAFDPPHVGHVALARAGIDRFDLKRLLVRVVADPGHKRVVSTAVDRLELARLAFADVEIAEVAVDAHPRTVDSLEQLGLADPVFLVGADEFASFLEWKEPERVLELARLGVATRPGVPRDRLVDVLDRLDRPDRVTFFEIPPVDASSCTIRRRVAAGAPIDGLVAASVAAEIDRRGLYRDPGRTGEPG
jgi:nicotinate-nucleotide adenylyltransferase